MKNVRLYILVTLFILFSQKLLAKEYKYTCIDDDFFINFEINTEEKTVLFLSSGNFKDGEAPFSKSHEKVIEMSERVISFTHKAGFNRSYSTIFLEQNYMISTRHDSHAKDFPDIHPVQSKIYNCIKR